MNKKVAICLSGQMRNLEKSFNEWIKPNIFDQNKDWDIDVFAHTWFSIEDVDKQYQLSGGRGVACSKMPPDVVTKLYSLYNPQKTLIEQQVDFKKIGNNSGGIWNPENRLSKMYSIKQSNILKTQFEKENDFRYNAVILLRYDMDARPIKLENYDLNCYNTSTHAAHAVDVTHAIMNSDVFNKFATLYDVALKTALETHILPPDEEIAKKLLDDLGVKIKTHRNLSGYSFVRS